MQRIDSDFSYIKAVSIRFSGVVVGASRLARGEIRVLRHFGFQQFIQYSTFAIHQKYLHLVPYIHLSFDDAVMIRLSQFPSVFELHGHQHRDIPILYVPLDNCNIVSFCSSLVAFYTNNYCLFGLNHHLTIFMNYNFYFMIKWENFNIPSIRKITYNENE